MRSHENLLSRGIDFLEGELLDGEPLVGEIPTIPTIFSKSTSQLRRIVEDFLADRIIFSCQVERSMLNMALVPMALGGLGYPVDRPDRKTPKPIAPTPPALPRRVQSPNRDVEFGNLIKALTDAEHHCAEVQYKHRWDNATEDDVALAEAELFKATKAKDDFLMADEIKVKKLNADVDEAYRIEMEAYDEALRQYNKNLMYWRNREDTLFAEWERNSLEWTEILRRQVGVIYGYLDDTRPRIIISADPQPVFLSIHMLNKADWDRVRIAIDREQSRVIEV